MLHVLGKIDDALCIVSRALCMCKLDHFDQALCGNFTRYALTDFARTSGRSFQMFH